MSGEAVKIAIRVRPFNDKEKSEKQKLCIEMVIYLKFLLFVEYVLTFESEYRPTRK